MTEERIKELATQAANSLGLVYTSTINAIGRLMHIVAAESRKDGRKEGIDSQRPLIELLEKALRDIEGGCTLPEDNVQRAIRDRARITFEDAERLKEQG